MTHIVQSIPAAALAQLRAAYEVLEHPSFAARLSSVIGMPIEASLRLLPSSWERIMRRAAESAIRQAFDMVVSTMPLRGSHGEVSNRLHAGACIGAGAVGGFFGLPGLVLELPVTTAVILRSIAGIAQGHGESLDDADTRAACIEVFAFGGPSSEDDAAETGYYGMRIAMAAHFSTMRLLTDRAAGEAALPSSVLMIRALASRFGLVISDKAAAQAVPVLGAAAGAPGQRPLHPAFPAHCHGAFQRTPARTRVRHSCGPRCVRGLSPRTGQHGRTRERRARADSYRFCSRPLKMNTASAMAPPAPQVDHRLVESLALEMQVSAEVIQRIL